MLTIDQQRRRIAAELARISARKSAQDPAAIHPDATLERAACTLQPIAIIGLSGSFPGCQSVSEFWNALDEDRRLIGKAPPNRFSFWTDEGSQRATRWGGYLPDIRGFDAPFFNVLPSEADLMDPRQRLLLMSVYHSLEDAGYAPLRLKKKSVGVFVAVEEDEYFQTIVESGIEPLVPVHGGASLVANRISYFLDLCGPSEVINTMCSGAAIALHRAVCSLRSGESSMAIVGAANLLLKPDLFLQIEATGQLSPDGQVHSFGKNAHGFVRAEGVASVVLKPLSLAEADGDPIYAVIQNSAVNYNGQGGMSMAAPNIATHAALIKSCYRNAGVDPQEIRYIEAQGMGSPVADIAEWEAFNRALVELGQEQGMTIPPGTCRVSTLKPTIGHMHSASALGALFKIIHSFAKNRIYGILGFSELSTELALNSEPCFPASKTESWPETSKPRVAGLHSYGAGGNNAHLLIAEYRTAVGSSCEEYREVIIPVSGRSVGQCEALLQQLLQAVEYHPEISIAAVARTMQRGRDSMPFRVAFVADSRSKWVLQVSSYLKGEKIEGVFDGVAKGTKSFSYSEADLCGTARAWAQGTLIESWPAAAVPCVHLPGYLFELKDHWYSGIQQPQAGSSRSSLQEGGAQQSEAERIVREVLCPYFKIASGELNLDVSFTEVGFDSVLVAQIAAKLKEKYSITVEPAQFFEFKTPRELARSLAQLNNNPLLKELPDSRKMIQAAGINDSSESIAIIGVAGRYPESPELNEFWLNLAEGRECISEIPKDRWPLSQHFDPNPETASKNGKSYGMWGGFIRGLNEFDPLFFKISPLEAESMSPKERLVLENVWHLLEDAGYAPKSLAGRRVGVFFGVTRAGWDAYPGTFSSVANRVSYFFDFQGPSMPIDTMCSSSLVAIHEACQHIRAGECEAAIAGGVNLYLDPSHFMILAHGRFLSPDGKCRAFGAEANGMVPGEGVGSVLLKTLSAAVRDGDQIYGVIRASATNHGGNANGFTVPNPAAHRDLILQALERANLNPRQITCIEAHGTGTPLGDPVEIRGLSEAYRKYTRDTGYCRLSSLKSNMGHLEAAAGIAGLTKILLQLKHRKLAPSLHSSVLNPNIDFSNSPFVVQQTLESWEPIDEKGHPISRMAAVSSFGAGGSNAHLVVEEYQSSERPALEDGQSKVILLSARSQTRLFEAAQNLHAFVMEHPTCSLSDVAYTLQIGREAMDERLAIIVTSLKDLQEKLNSYLKKEQIIPGLFSGRAKSKREGAVPDLSDEDLVHLLTNWIQKREFEKIVKAWTGGMTVNWNILYPQHIPRRVSLPLYPFAREAIAVPNLNAGSGKASPEGFLHPLAHRNSSRLGQHRFSSEFTGREFFLSDHVVQKRKILPGAAYLELARAAIAQSVQVARPENDRSIQPIQFSDVLWVRPLAVTDNPVEVHVNLSGAEGGPVEYEILSDSDGGAAAPLTHGSGTMHFESIAAPGRIDLNAVRLRTAGSSLSAPQCYDLFNRLGIDYGPAHQGLEMVYFGSDEVLARLRLPPCVAQTTDQYVLHPSILDSAFQASIGLNLQPLERHQNGNAHVHNGNGTTDKNGFDFTGPIKPALPYAIERVEVFSRFSSTMWALIRRPAGYQKSEKLQKFDLDLCDDSGVVCVRIKGFSARVLDSGNATPEPQSLLMQVPAWESKPLRVRPAGSNLQFQRRIVVICSEKNKPIDLLREHLALRTADCFHVEIKGKNLAKDYYDCVLQTFRVIKEVLESKPRGGVLIQVMIAGKADCLPHSGLIGLLRTAMLEFPKLHGQLIQIDTEISEEALAKLLEENAFQSEDVWIRYRGRQREVFSWSEFSSSAGMHPWKQKGVYLITGGFGGLGKIFASEIAARVESPSLILIGRSEIDEDGRCFLESLKKQGANAIYRSVDLRQREKVVELIAEITETNGGLNGILHTAGTLRDQYLIKKSAKDIEIVLGPKVTGTFNLDEATRNLHLDFFVLFSSASSLGNPGQGDYAAANAFLDAFARYRNDLVSAKERFGGTLAINWPFWKDGGMRMDAAAERLMTENTGLHAMETQTGLEAFYRCIASDQSQILVLNGNPDRIRKTFLKDLAASWDVPNSQGAVQSGRPEVAAPRTSVSVDLTLSTCGYLKKVICDTLKIKPEEMELDKDLYSYGLDSILVLEVNNQLERCFPRLSKTLFFEYSTIIELAGYFVEAHSDVLKSLFTIPDAAGRLSEDFSRAEDCVPANAIPHDLNGGRIQEVTSSEQGTGAGERPVLRSILHDGNPAQQITIDQVIRRLDIDVQHSRGATRVSRETWPGWNSVFQSFGIFEQRESGFSFSRMIVNPEKAVMELTLYLKGQVEIRRVLFRKEDFSHAKKVLDLGCGRAADLLEIVLTYPGIEAHGLTINPEEANFAKAVTHQKGASDRIRIHCADNSSHRFEPNYDIIFSIQTMHFLTELERKRKLFEKVAASLNESGALVMAEFVCHLKKPMRDPVLKTTVHTAQEWAELLSQSGLLLDEVIDLSPEVINFLIDPNLEDHIDGLDREKQIEIRKYNGQIGSLEKKWVSYCVLRAVKNNASHSFEETMRINLERMTQRSTFGKVKSGVRNGKTPLLYRNLVEHLKECIESVSPIGSLEACD
jgi:acyl transferase domain-containing protein/acyl carrier protein/trans-aconitate methyltransferase